MTVVFSVEQAELGATVRRYLADKSSEDIVRKTMQTAEGYDAAVWAQMAGELGLQGLAIPEKFGGGGFSFLDLAVVFEETGRALLCSPFYSTVGLAASCLLATGNDDACLRYLPAIANGELIATTVWRQMVTQPGDRSRPVSATIAGGGWHLDGDASFVTDGCTARLILVPAEVDGAAALFAVEGDVAGLTRTPLPMIDLTRRWASLRFTGVPARRIHFAPGRAGAIEMGLHRASAALAMEQVGGAQRIFELTLDYCKTRVQYGRVIGGFQAVKHRLADLLLDLEGAKSAAYEACGAVAAEDPALPVIAAVAKSACSDTFVHIATEAIQLHGGIGFTWEHPAHLFFKRAHASAQLLGDPTLHRELLAHRLGM